MKRETRTVLETPFTPDQIKSRKGLWGKTLDYIEGHSVIQRLNEAFESDWSFEITEHSVYEEEVVAIGKLTVGNITKMQFGSNKITRDSETHKALSLGDDLKSASTDALKKCASLLGIGLHLYGDVGGTIETPQKKVGRPKNSSPAPKKADTTPESSQPAAPQPSTPVPPPKPAEVPKKPEVPKSAPSNGGNGSGNNGNGDNGNNDKITPKQLNYVMALGKRQNLTTMSLDGMSKEMFDVTLAYITKNQASALIQRLTA